jgi:hypothetical protein
MSQTPDKDRIDELGEDIEEAREQAEDHGTLPQSDPDPTFIDPEGDGHVDEDDAGTSFAL